MVKRKVKIKIVPEEIFYYEGCAAKANNITVEKMFLGGRQRDSVIARYFCAWFMVERLKKSLALAGDRYGLDHATVIHGLKTIKINAERRDALTREHDDRFTDFKAKVTHIYLVREKSSFIDKLHVEINEKGFNMFLSNIASDFNKLTLFLLNYGQDGSKSTENDILEKSIACSENIEKLKSLFSHDS